MKKSGFSSAQDSAVKEQIDIISEKEICGIIMPISDTPAYKPGHWRNVLTIIEEVVHECGMEAKLVSDKDEVGIIHKDIIQNLYLNKLVICDVSSKNPNVFFELGIRLTFDKATIVIKDDLTNIVFDTSPIRYIEYPADLRWNEIILFKTSLKKTILATIKVSNDPQYSSFLGNFSISEIPRLQSKESTHLEEMRSELSQIRKDIGKISILNLQSSSNYDNKFWGENSDYKILLNDSKVNYDDKVKEMVELIPLEISKIQKMEIAIEQYFTYYSRKGVIRNLRSFILDLTSFIIDNETIKTSGITKKEISSYLKIRFDPSMQNSGILIIGTTH